MQVRETGDGVLVTVRVQPRSSRPGVEVRGDTIAVRVGAPPVAGRATEEARSVLADRLGVRPGAVTLESGPRSRSKVFRVRGVTPEAAHARLREGR